MELWLIIVIIIAALSVAIPIVGFFGFQWYNTRQRSKQKRVSLTARRISLAPKIIPNERKASLQIKVVSDEMRKHSAPGLMRATQQPPIARRASKCLTPPRPASNDLNDIESGIRNATTVPVPAVKVAPLERTVSGCYLYERELMDIGPMPRDIEVEEEMKARSRRGSLLSVN